jgi:hypothetical protein
MTNSDSGHKTPKQNFDLLVSWLNQHTRTIACNYDPMESAPNNKDWHRKITGYENGQYLV